MYYGMGMFYVTMLAVFEGLSGVDGVLSSEWYLYYVHSNYLFKGFRGILREHLFQLLHSLFQRKQTL